MVVTRKEPIAPPTPSSRTNSSQPLSRVAKGKSPANGAAAVDATGSSSVTQPVGLDQSDDGSGDKSQKSKSKSKNKKAAKKQRKARNSFFALIRDILFGVLLIYSLFVCSPDKPVTPDSHPICRALSASHHRIVEPYILTPLRPVLDHPSVAPYVQRVEPYRQKVITTGEFVIDQTRTQWIRRVIPQWNQRVVPQWNKFVVPELKKLEAKVEPYRSQLEREYHRAVAPRVRLAQYNLERWYRLSQPYITLAAQKAQTGYQVAKPYAIPALQRSRQVLLRVLAFLQEQRRQFVDPHVITLLGKVTELSTGKAQQIKSQVYTAVSSAREASSSLSSRVQTASSSAREAESSVTSKAATVASSASETLSSVASAAQSTASSLVSGVSAEFGVDTPLASPPATIVEAEVPSSYSSDPSTSSWSSAAESATETLSSVSSVIATHAEDASSSVASLVKEATSTVESLVAEVTGPSKTPSFVAPQPTSAPGGDDFELNEFIDILGDLDSDEPEPFDTDDILDSMPTPSETAEEKEARRKRTAEKRRDITSRHAKWEEELEALIKAKKKELRKSLVALRKAAVTELKESKEIQGEVEGLVEEAEKFLKGADGYLKTLKKEDRSVQDKERLWGKVLDRVEKRFEERIDKVVGLVNEWHGTVQYREMQEVNDVAEAVKDLAERAQADIGMDYAWLDDVDYTDWVRYHDLMRASENFTQQALMIQNGTHPSPPINPVLPALNDLEAEIKDIVTGFQTRVRGLKRSGHRAFGGSNDEEDADNQDSEDKSDAPTTPQSPIPDASILPVPDPEKDTATGAALPVIGRSKEEVIDALGRAEEALKSQGQASSSTKTASQGVTPEEAVESLVQDVEAEAEKAAPSAHQEL